MQLHKTRNNVVGDISETIAEGINLYLFSTPHDKNHCLRELHIYTKGLKSVIQARKHSSSVLTLVSFLPRQPNSRDMWDTLKLENKTK